MKNKTINITSSKKAEKNLSWKTVNVSVSISRCVYVDCVYRWLYLLSTPTAKQGESDAIKGASFHMNN